MYNRILVMICLVLLIVLTGEQVAAAQATHVVERGGDMLQIALPFTAYGLTYPLDDPRGRRNLAATVFSALSVTYMLKYAIPRERPNGDNTLSFISGHTSLAFASAAFLQRRYGWKFGLPSCLAAAFVGWSRVESKQHYSDDVVRGAAIGILSAYIFTKPDNGQLRIALFTDNYTVGLALQGTW